MRIAFLTESAEIWGAEHSLAGILSVLGSHDCEVVVICPFQSALPDFLESQGIGVDVLHLNLGNRSSARPSGLIDRLFFYARRVALTIVDVFRIVPAIRHVDVAVSFSLWQNLSLAIAGRFAATPVVLDIHDVVSKGAPKLLSSVAALVANEVVAPSRSVLDCAGVRGRGIVVPRGVGSDQLPDNPPFSGSRFRIGLIGEVRPNKNAMLFAEAIVAASKRLPHIEGVIVGSVNEDQCGRDLRSFAAESSEVLTLLGKVDDVNSVLGDLDAVVNCSSEEAFGRTLLEALSAGRIPICFECCGASSVLSGLGVGVVVEGSPSSSSLADAFLTCWRQRAHLSRSVAMMRESFLSQYSWQAVGSEYESVLARIGGRTRGLTD